jgi:hypothetical protein
MQMAIHSRNGLFLVFLMLKPNTEKLSVILLIYGEDLDLSYGRGMFTAL